MLGTAVRDALGVPYEYATSQVPTRTPPQRGSQPRSYVMKRTTCQAILL
jgi:hypothetical protein